MSTPSGLVRLVVVALKEAQLVFIRTEGQPMLVVIPLQHAVPAQHAVFTGTEANASATVWETVGFAERREERIQLHR